MKIDLHIEKLVLRGLNPPHRDRITSALEAELQRLIEEQGAPEDLQNRRDLRLEGGTYRVSRNAKAEAIGTEVAQKIHTGWTDGGEES